MIIVTTISLVKMLLMKHAYDVTFFCLVLFCLFFFFFWWGNKLLVCEKLLQATPQNRLHLAIWTSYAPLVQITMIQSSLVND